MAKTREGYPYVGIKKNVVPSRVHLYATKYEDVPSRARNLMKCHNECLSCGEKWMQYSTKVPLQWY